MPSLEGRRSGSKHFAGYDSDERRGQRPASAAKLSTNLTKCSPV